MSNTKDCAVGINNPDRKMATADRLYALHEALMGLFGALDAFCQENALTGLEYEIAYVYKRYVARVIGVSGGVLMKFRENVLTDKEVLTALCYEQRETRKMLMSVIVRLCGALRENYENSAANEIAAFLGDYSADVEWSKGVLARFLAEYEDEFLS